VRREPDRAEAWFYLGAAYGSRVQYNAQRGEYFAAARDGKRIKTSLEQAISLDPALYDAYFGIGLYQYYADTAPAVLKMLRWLLLLPGGNKVEGMKQMLQARERGTLLKAEAAYQLHLIDIWYEHKPDEALGLLGELRAHYPHNPIFVLNTAHVLEVYKSDRGGALAAYRSLVDGARAGTFREPVLAEASGHLGAAAQLRALSQPDLAIEEAQWVIDHAPSVPYGAVALAQLETARAWAAKGARDKAAAAYRAAIAAAPPDDPRHVRRDAERGLARLR
jgi:tetratricopeptide (TPR) repeat protein